MLKKKEKKEFGFSHVNRTYLNLTAINGLKQSNSDLPIVSTCGSHFSCSTVHITYTKCYSLQHAIFFYHLMMILFSSVENFSIGFEEKGVLVLSSTDSSRHWKILDTINGLKRRQKSSASDRVSQSFAVCSTTLAPHQAITDSFATSIYTPHNI